MGQRLFKVIFFIALMVSVFFCSVSSVALADEDVGEFIGYIDTEENTQYFDLTPLADLEEDDYTGSALFQVLSQRGSMYFQYAYNDSSADRSDFLGAYVAPVYITIGFQVERGHTYSGAVSLVGSTNVDLDDNFMSSTNATAAHISSFVFNGYEEVSPESIDVSIYPVLVYQDDGEADYTININFNNYQSTYDGYVYVNVCMNFELSTMVVNSKSEWWLQRSIAVINTHATDWAGTLKDYATEAIVDSDGSLISNQTQQQQQIADQQSQQSAQQHENLVNGYDNVANDSMLSDKNSVLQGFEQQQDDAINSGQQHVADFSAQYDTAIFSSMAPSFALVSMMFNSLWNGMGQFSTVLIIGLVLCVAGYILKLKH